VSSKKTTGKIILTFDKVNQILAYLSGVLLALITLAVCVEVIVRKLWNVSIIGVVECSEYAIVFITFLSASWILRQDAHVKVDIVIGWLKPGTRPLLNMVTSFYGAVLCMFITYRCATVIWDLWRRDLDMEKALELPMSPLYTAMLIGSFMLFLGFLRRGYACMVERKKAMNSE